MIGDCRKRDVEVLDIGSWFFLPINASVICCPQHKWNGFGNTASMLLHKITDREDMDDEDDGTEEAYCTNSEKLGNM